MAETDLISRKGAIDALGEKPLAWTEGEYELGLQNQWQSDVDALKEVPPAQPEQRWISAAERLPEKDGHYVVTVHPDFVVPECEAVDLIYFKDGKWQYIDYDYKAYKTKLMEFPYPIIAWMPLPEPWKGKDYGKNE